MALSSDMPVSLCWCLSGWYVLDSCLNLTRTSLSLAFGYQVLRKQISEERLFRFSNGGVVEEREGEGMVGCCGCGCRCCDQEEVVPVCSLLGFFSFSILWSQFFLFIAMWI